jgi:hypothetical protein
MNCKIEGCGQQTAGQSKYCKAHRAESRKRFKEMVAQQAVEREERSERFAELWHRACEAGRLAAEAAKPQMVVAIDEMSGETFDPFPICGFAWINVSPGNCQFANWLKKNGFGRKAYGSGVEVWIGDYNQSYDMKMAHAGAAAKILVEAGIKAYAGGRLD